MLLHNAVGNEKRPLAWNIGPQEIVKPGRPSQRNAKREERTRATTLRPPDEV